MNLEEFNRRVDEVLMNGYLDADCTECGFTIQVETDATTAWCHNCDKLVKINNFMVQMGFI